MNEFSPDQERLLKQVVSSFRCSVCRRSFEREHVRVTARHEQLWIVSVRCRVCRNQQVFWVALKGDESGVDSVLRDMNRAEEEYFAELAPVSGDDVLDMYEFLREFDGDFKALFAHTQ